MLQEKNYEIFFRIVKIYSLSQSEAKGINVLLFFITYKYLHFE